MGKVWQNTGWQILGRAISVVASLGVTIFLTRLLSAQNYGNYIFVTTFVLLFLNFSDLGISLVGVTKAARRKNPQPIYNLAFVLKTGLALIAWLTFILLVFFLPQFKNLHLPGLIASLAILFLTLRMSAEIIFRTELNFRQKTLFESLGSILFLISISWLFWQKETSLSRVIIFWSLSAGVSSLLAFLAVRKSFKLISLPAGKDLKALFGQSLPLGIRQLVFATYDQGIDNFFLKTFSTSFQLGFYGLSYKIYQNLTTTASFFMNSLLPTISRQNKDQLRQTFLKSLKILFFSGVLLASGLWVFSELIIRILAGPEFASSVIILRILSLSLIFSFLNHSTGYTMIALGRQKQLLHLSLIGLAINLIGNLIAIPLWHSLGAAWVTVITEMAMFFLTLRSLSNYNTSKV